MSMGLLAETVVIFLLLMLPGVLLGRGKLLPNAALPGLTNIVMYTAMPALVFVKLLQTDLSVLSLSGVLCCICLPVVMGLLLLLMAWLLCRWDLLEDFSVSGVCAAFPNCGFWSIPLASVLFPAQPEVVVYVSLFNVFNSVMLLTVGVGVISGDRREISLKGVLCNPVVMAISVGLLFSVMGWSVPVLEEFSLHLSRLATPLSMLILGAETSRLKPKDLLGGCHLCIVAGLKLVVSPLIAVGILWFLRSGLRIPIEDSLQYAVFLATAVSTALSVPGMAAKYGKDSKYAAVLTIGTTMLCVVTMPLLYQFMEYAEK